MGRSAGNDENGLKKGPWTAEEDQKLIDYIERNGHGSWRALPMLAGLNRCGKSCRLRWTNYLRPDIKRGNFTEDEEKLIIRLHSHLGNKWSAIATHLPGRTDNEIKNFWNTHLKKKLIQNGIDPVTHQPRTDHLAILANLPQLLAVANTFPFIDNMNALRTLQSDATQIAKFQLLQNILRVLTTTNNTTPSPSQLDALFGPSIHNSPFLAHQLLEHLTLNPHQDQINMNVLHGILPAVNVAPSGLPPYPSQLTSSSSTTTYPLSPSDHHAHLQHPTNIDDHNSFRYSINESSSHAINGTKDHEYSVNTPTNNIPSFGSVPGLVSASPKRHSPMSSTDVNIQLMGGNNNKTIDVFEGWEGLMDDEESGSYLRNILGQTQGQASTSWST